MRAMMAGWMAGLALLVAAPCEAQTEAYLSARQIVDYLHSQDDGQRKIAEATIVITKQAFMTSQASLTARKAGKLYCPASDAQITDQQLADGIAATVAKNAQLADMPVSMAMLVYLEGQYPCAPAADK